MENIFQFHKNSDVGSIARQIEEWISEPEFVALLLSFGKTEIQAKSLRDKIGELIEFSSVWDFRGRQGKDGSNNTENARWTVKDYGFGRQQEEEIIKTAKKLGLIGCSKPSKRRYDFILVLGGARMSCLFRMRYAKQLCEQLGVKAKSIIGLSGMRAVMESEREATDTYALGAETEFDLMRSAFMDTFGEIELNEKEESVNSNLNSSWKKEVYRVSDMDVVLLAAPSGEPEKRRANTSDTFSFFEKQLQVEDKKNILLITSQIYVPYQQLEAVRILGVPYHHSLETIGFPNGWSVKLQGLQKPENYLQEIRSVLQSAGRLLEQHGN